MANADLKPEGSTAGHKLRKERIMNLATYYFDGLKDSPYMDAENTREIFAGTQFEGENHRRMTPYLQALWAQARDRTMLRLDGFSRMGVIDNEFDVVIIGSGPHGAAVTAYLREKRPKTRVLLLDKGLIGGQFRSYGKKPAFFMNSRVRKADRTLPNLPRTEGSINPLGIYAPLELSDVATSLYPSNVDMGDLTALNGFVSASWCQSGVTVTKVEYNYENKRGRKVYGVNQEGSPVVYYADMVVDATGMPMGSRLPFGQRPGDRDGYFTGPTFYKHFGSHTNPLKMFHDTKVMVVGGGDSALTVLEALVGQLPGESYGMGSVGRYRPRSIQWWGAPRTETAALTKCLRSRYRNGIPQALAGQGRYGLIQPIRGNVTGVDLSSDFFFEVAGDDLELGGKRYEYPNILVDCTRKAITRQNNWVVDYRIGPESGLPFSPTIQRAVETLQIPENNVSLWATMQQTDQISRQIIAYLNGEY